MTLGKTIKVLSDELEKCFPGIDDELIAALKLGIKAGERIQEWRKYHNLIPEWLLPGETVE